MDSNYIFLFLGNYQNLLYFVMGILVSYVFYKLSIKGATLIYDSSSDVIINKDTERMPEGIEIQYNEEFVSKLVRTYVFLWNNGNRAVRRDDLVNSDKLRVEFNGVVQIYSIKIVKNSDKSNGFQLKQSNDAIELDFDYLERRSGVKIEILHNQESPRIVMKGKIIDIKEGIKNSKDLINTKINSFSDIVSFLTMYFTAFASGFGMLLLATLVYSKIAKLDFIMFIGFFLLGIIPAVVSPILLKKFARSKKHPSYLD